MQAKLRKYLTSDFMLHMVWNIVAAVGTRVCSLLGIIYIAREIGVEKFGEVAVAQVTAILLISFAQSAVGAVSTKLIAENQNDALETSSIISITQNVTHLYSIGSAMIIYFLADFLAVHWFDKQNLSSALEIISVLVFFGAQVANKTGILAGLSEYKGIGRASTMAAVVGLPIAMLMTARFGLNGALWSFVISQVIQYFLVEMEYRRALNARGIETGHSNSIQTIYVLKKYIAPAVLSNIFVMPSNWLAISILTTQNNGLSEMGIYNAANQWRNLVLFIPATLGSLYISTLSTMPLKSPERRTFVNRASLVNLLIGIVVIIVCLVFSGELIGVYGGDFSSGGHVLTALIFSAVIISINNLYSKVALSAGNPWLAAKFDIVWAIGFLAVSCWLVPKYSAYGLSLACIFAALIQLAYQLASKNKVI